MVDLGIVDKENFSQIHAFPRPLNTAGIKSLFSLVDDGIGSHTQFATGHNSHKSRGYIMGLISKAYRENFAYAELSFEETGNSHACIEDQLYHSVTFTLKTADKKAKDLAEALDEDAETYLKSYFNTH
jgi:hypothetical protein